MAAQINHPICTLRPAARRGLLLLLLLPLLACAPELDFGGPVADWPEYGGDKGGARHSPLTQIHRGNVKRLRIAWVHRSGDWLSGEHSLAPSSFQATPIAAGGALYYCTPKGRVFALDAETGAERWVFDPQVDVSRLYITNCRGVSRWVDSRAAAGAFCSERIVLGTLDARLIALDAQTGRPCPGFGADGTLDLRHGIGDVQPGEYGVTSAPTIIGDRIVTGTMVLDNRRSDAPSGVVRAYHARSGELLWAWDPVPPGQSVAGDGARYRRGTANAWTPLSADPTLGLVYVPTGNTSPDHYGGQRDGLDYYSSSVVALDAESGAVRWRFQAVHHDIWDYDMPAQPTLFDFPGAAGARPGLAQPTKMGFLYLLDRRNGAPLFPVEERPAPQLGAVPGETLSPTQPFPLRPPPLHPTAISPGDGFGFTPLDRRACRSALAKLQSGPIFTPPSLQGSVLYPGMIGGMNWGGASVDHGRGLLAVNVQSIATRVQLLTRAEVKARWPDGLPAYGVEPQEGTPYAVMRQPLLSPLGAPCNPPPWGELVGIDLKSGEIRWRTVLGTTRDLAPWPFWFRTGAPNLGGPLTTSGGLIFIGATTDFFLRAFDSETGELLWRHRLPTAAQATPMTYRAGPGSRQFVVIAAGGHGILGTPPSDALIAFALPH